MERMKNEIEHFNFSTNDGKSKVQHPVLILVHMKYECATHSEPHGFSDASIDARLPTRMVTWFVTSQTSLFLGQVCLVCVSPLELALSLVPPHRTHLDLPDEADTAQRNRSQPTVNTSSYIHISTVRSLPYFISHNSTGSSPSLDRIDFRERNATECSVVAVALGLKTLRGTACRQ
jgi:hypothetical protein